MAPRRCGSSSEFRGTSINLTAVYRDELARSIDVPASSVKVVGFDTFEGLPEAWHSLPAGAYSTGGRVPDMGEGVTLHRGLFSQTLPPFLDGHDGALRLAHIDCDLYSATETALEALAPRVTPGTVLVFDEYLMNPRWREDEHRALVEVGKRHGWTWRYAAFSLLAHQAVVQVTET